MMVTNILEKERHFPMGFRRTFNLGLVPTAAGKEQGIVKHSNLKNIEGARPMGYNRRKSHPWLLSIIYIAESFLEGCKSTRLRPRSPSKGTA